jgi:hypothetical protein
MFVQRSPTRAMSLFGEAGEDLRGTHFVLTKIGRNGLHLHLLYIPKLLKLKEFLKGRLTVSIVSMK